MAADAPKTPKPAKPAAAKPKPARPKAKAAPDAKAKSETPHARDSAAQSATGGASGEGRDLLGRDGHRRHCTGGQQHVGGEGLRDSVRDAMHPRPALAEPFEDVGSDLRQFAVRRPHLSPSAGMTRIRFDGLAFASQPSRNGSQAPHEMREN